MSMTPIRAGVASSVHAPAAVFSTAAVTHPTSRETRSQVVGEDRPGRLP
jgi:hypothetical protein